MLSEDPESPEESASVGNEEFEHPPTGTMSLDVTVPCDHCGCHGSGSSSVQGQSTSGHFHPQSRVKHSVSAPAMTGSESVQFRPQESVQFRPQEPVQYCPQESVQYSPQESAQYSPQEYAQCCPQDPVVTFPQDSEVEDAPVSVIGDKEMPCCAKEREVSRPVSVIGDKEMPCCAGNSTSYEESPAPVSVIGDKEMPCCAKKSSESLKSGISGAESISSMKISSSANVSSVESFPEYDINPNMKMSDVKNRLSELIKWRGPDLIQACRNFDRKLTKRVNKNHFKMILRMFCFPITAAQFDSLCREANMPQTGKIEYIDFFEKISGKKRIPEPDVPEKISDDLPLDEIELRIKEKIAPRLRDIIRSFWLFDLNKDGFIQKTELRRIIRNYCFQISDDAFNQFWKSINPTDSMLINYKEFLVKIGIDSDRYKKYVPHDTVAMALCWQDRISRALADDISSEQRKRRAATEGRDDPSIQGLPIEEVAIIFKAALQKKSNLLKSCFNLFDHCQDARIAMSDFRGVINFFVLPMSTMVFDQVMKRLGFESTAVINYKDFMSRVCKPHLGQQLQNGTQKPKTEKLDCYPVVQRIKNHVLNPCARLKTVFTKFNSENEWQITRQELRKAIEAGLDFRLSNDEYKELNSILDPDNTNEINCGEFLRLFEAPGDGATVPDEVEKENRNYEENPEESPDLNEKDLKTVQKFYSLRGEKLKSKLKHYLNKNRLNIEKMFLINDCSHCGFLAPEQILHVLNGLCMPLSQTQFEEIMSDIRRYGERYNYKEFLDAYKKNPDEDMKRWTGIVEKLTPFKSRCPPDLAIDECEELLRECLTSRKSSILKDFTALDMCTVGVVCKDDVRNIFNKYVFRFNDKQFDELWKMFPRNTYDQLHYDRFLDEFARMTRRKKKKEEALPSRNPPAPCPLHGHYAEQKEKEMKRNEKDRDRLEECRKTAKEMLYAQAPRLKSIIDAMEATIVRNARNIRFHLHRADPKVTGTVDFNVFKSVLSRAGVFLGKEDEFHILEHFDSHLSGRINYRKFLRLFVWYA